MPGQQSSNAASLIQFAAVSDATLESILACPSLPCAARPALARDMFSRHGLLGPLRFVWIGTSGPHSVAVEAWAPEGRRAPATLRLAACPLDRPDTPSSDQIAEVLAAAAARIFQTTTVLRVEVLAVPGTPPDGESLARAGFAREGVSRSAAIISGKPVDVAIHARVRADWSARPRRMP